MFQSSYLKINATYLKSLNSIRNGEETAIVEMLPVAEIQAFIGRGGGGRPTIFRQDNILDHV